MQARDGRLLGVAHSAPGILARCPRTLAGDAGVRDRETSTNDGGSRIMQMQWPAVPDPMPQQLSGPLFDEGSYFNNGQNYESSPFWSGNLDSISRFLEQAGEAGGEAMPSARLGCSTRKAPTECSGSSARGRSKPAPLSQTGSTARRTMAANNTTRMHRVVRSAIRIFRSTATRGTTCRVNPICCTRTPSPAAISFRRRRHRRMRAVSPTINRQRLPRTAAVRKSHWITTATRRSRRTA